MRLGLTMFATDEAMNPVDLARAAEDRGFYSIYLPEHTHIPTSRTTPAPTGEPMPDEYRRTLDPFIALSAMAAVTTRIRLGTGICLIAQRDPLVTAKAAATLDMLSGGRFLFGVGYGWNIDEIENHGIDPRSRRSVLREKVLAMKRLWIDDIASFHGDHVDLQPSWAWPKPAQRPHPPILIGGAPGPTLFRHVAEFADGWLPVGGAGIKSALDDLWRAADAAGRDPSTIDIIPFGSFPTPEKLEYFASMGISEVVCRLPSAPADEVLPQLERLATFLPGLDAGPPAPHDTPQPDDGGSHDQ